MLLATAGILSAQNFSYQAVVRNHDDATNQDTLVHDTEINLEVNIFNGPVTNPVVYKEVHKNVLTSPNGLVSILIGTGVDQYQSMDLVDWSNATISVDFKLADGTLIGTSEMKVQPVPYAIQAGGGNLTTDQIADYVENQLTYNDAADIWQAVVQNQHNLKDDLKDTLVKYIKANKSIAKEVAEEYLHYLDAGNVREAYNALIANPNGVKAQLKQTIIDYIKSKPELAREIVIYYLENATSADVNNVYAVLQSMPATTKLALKSRIVDYVKAHRDLAQRVILYFSATTTTNEASLAIQYLHDNNSPVWNRMKDSLNRYIDLYMAAHAGTTPSGCVDQIMIDHLVDSVIDAHHFAVDTCNNLDLCDLARRIDSLSVDCPEIGNATYQYYSGDGSIIITAPIKNYNADLIAFKDNSQQNSGKVRCEDTGDNRADSLGYIMNNTLVVVLHPNYVSAHAGQTVELYIIMDYDGVCAQRYDVNWKNVTVEFPQSSEPVVECTGYGETTNAELVAANGSISVSHALANYNPEFVSDNALFFVYDAEGQPIQAFANGIPANIDNGLMSVIVPADQISYYVGQSLIFRPYIALNTSNNSCEPLEGQGPGSDPVCIPFPSTVSMPNISSTTYPDPTLSEENVANLTKIYTAAGIDVLSTIGNYNASFIAEKGYLISEDVNDVAEYNAQYAVIGTDSINSNNSTNPSDWSYQFVTKIGLASCGKTFYVKPYMKLKNCTQPFVYGDLQTIAVPAPGVHTNPAADTTIVSGNSANLTVQLGGMMTMALQGNYADRITIGWREVGDGSVNCTSSPLVTSHTVTVTPQVTATYTAFIEVYYGNDVCTQEKQIQVTVQ